MSVILVRPDNSLDPTIRIIILRKFFLYHRKLLSKLCQCVSESLLLFLRTVMGLGDGVFGAVFTIQTFGDYAKWHPHIHA